MHSEVLSFVSFEGTWSTTGNLTTERYLHTASVLLNGKVLVVGGYDGSTYLNRAELYDPSTGELLSGYYEITIMSS